MSYSYIYFGDYSNRCSNMFEEISETNYISGFVLVSRWDCFIASWNLILLWSEPWIGTMLLVISIDRFLAVTIPMRYFTFTTNYSYSLVGISYFVAVPIAAYGAYLSYQSQNPQYAAVCYESNGMEPTYYSARTFFRIAACMASVLLYIPILIQLKRVSSFMS
jgi:hypothetical protein